MAEKKRYIFRTQTGKYMYIDPSSGYPIFMDDFMTVTVFHTVKEALDFYSHFSDHGERDSYYSKEGHWYLLELHGLDTSPANSKIGEYIKTISCDRQRMIDTANLAMDGIDKR